MKRFAKPQDIEVGVIGYGAAFNMGRAHFNEMKAAGMVPVAVAELNPERRKAAEAEFPGIRTFDTPQAMLKESDVALVAILTPHNTHAELAVQCLRAGRHVVCEKPFAVTTAECDAMIREARKRRLLLSAYHNRHWDGCVMEAVRRIRERKEIGEVYRIEAHMGGRHEPGAWWRSSKSISGGILYDWGAHLLEYSLQIMDSPIVEVTGFAQKGFWAKTCAWKDDTIEDEALAVLRYANGGWMTLNMSSLDSNPKRGIMEITGTEGSYVMEHGDYEIIQRRAPQTISTRGRNCPSESARFYQNVANHLVNGEPLVITAERARMPIHVMDLAGRSAAAGKALRTKYTQP